MLVMEHSGGRGDEAVTRADEGASLLSVLAATAPRERWPVVAARLSAVWTVDPERDDEGCVHDGTARVVPLLVELLRDSTADPESRGRAALLLGLIAEGRGSAAGACRTALRMGLRAYLDAVVGAGPAEAAVFFLLAHFPEDRHVITDTLRDRVGDGHPAFAQMRRALDPPSALRRLGDVDQLVASTLAEMGAAAEFALPMPELAGREAQTDTEPSPGLGQRLMEDRALVKLYELQVRPQFLRVMGRNWADDLTPADEDAYLLAAPGPASGPVLDLACGAGRWTAVVAGKVGAARTIGLDLSWPMLVETKARLPAVPLVRGSALRLPFADATLAGASCFNALQLLPTPGSVLRELGRCMRRDSVITCFTFRRAPRGVYRYFQSRFERATGVRSFREDDIRRWLEDAGMTLLDLGGPNLCLFFTARKR
jgi:SAM-dependent methyltransferase